MTEWRYSSTHSYPRHYTEVRGKCHALATEPLRKGASGTHSAEGLMGPKVKMSCSCKDLNQKVEHNHGHVCGTAQVLQHCHNQHMCPEHSQRPLQNAVYTHGCQCPHWPSTFSKTVFTTHSPRRHHRPASHGVPSAHGIYCVRQPDCSPKSVVHHSCLHTGYKKCRTLSLTGKTYMNQFCLLANISKMANGTIRPII